MTADALRPEADRAWPQADLSFAAEALAAFLLMGVCPAGYDREDLAEFVARLTRLAAPPAGVTPPRAPEPPEQFSAEALRAELDVLDAIAADDSPYSRGMRCATGHLRDWLTDCGCGDRDATDAEEAKASAERTMEKHRASLERLAAHDAARPLAPSGPQKQNGEWPPFRDDGKTLNRPHEFDKDPETGFCVICGWSDSVHFPLAPSGTPAEEDAAGALDNYIAGLLKRAESAEAVHAALRDECRRWRAAMAYLVGDVADAGTPEECRATWDRQQADARDAEARLAALRARLEKLAESWERATTLCDCNDCKRIIDAWRACAAALLAALREEQETTT